MIDIVTGSYKSYEDKTGKLIGMEMLYLVGCEGRFSKTLKCEQT